MSAFGKRGVRCDTCGKFSKNPQGEYTRKDGSAGYIWLREEDDSKDDCDDCLEAQRLQAEGGSQ